MYQTQLHPKLKHLIHIQTSQIPCDFWSCRSGEWSSLVLRYTHEHRGNTDVGSWDITRTSHCITNSSCELTLMRTRAILLAGNPYGTNWLSLKATSRQTSVTSIKIKVSYRYLNYAKKFQRLWTGGDCGVEWDSPLLCSIKSSFKLHFIIHYSCHALSL